MCRDLFRVWLPAGYESSWVVCAILMITFFGSITQTTSYYVLLGGGRIKGIALSYLATAVAAVILSIYLVGYLNQGILGAAFCLIIPQVISMFLFQSWYACSQVRLGFGQYLWNSYSRPALCVIPCLCLGALLVNLLPPKNLFYWILEYIVALGPFAVFALTGVLDWPLRKQIMGKLKSFFT